MLNKLKELPAGGFIVSGSCTQFEGLAVDGVFRTDAEGVPDTTFHSGVFWGSARDYLPLPDGRVYIVGNYQTNHAANDTVRLGRFLRNGSLDPTFGIPHFSLGLLPNTGGLGPSVARVRPWGAGHLLVTGQFQYVNGQPRRGICVMDTTGVLSDDFDACGVSSFTYSGITNASVHGLVTDADSTHYYIWGTYTGYDDGTTNDTLQRFVTRLHVGDISTSAPAVANEPLFSLYPNPSSGAVTLQLATVPRNATLIVRDALGREVQRHRVTDHYTTLTMAHSGVYSVEVWDAHGRMATERVVVQ
ncbi:MAG: T9SS type A sorting domain-containing protein [Flavobacteriales bacterium]